MSFVLEENEKIELSVYGEVRPSEEIGEDQEIPCRLALTDKELVLYKFRDDYFVEKADQTIVLVYQRWALADIKDKSISVKKVTTFGQKRVIAICTRHEKVFIECGKDDAKDIKIIKKALKVKHGFKFF